VSRRAAGFTLLEVLVAISLMALLSVLGYRGLDSLLHSRDDLGRRDEALAMLAQTWTWLERDCAALLPESQAAGGVVRLALSRDEQGQTVLALSTAAPGVAAGQRVPLTVTYRLVAGRLERSERAPGAAAGEPAAALQLAAARAWSVAAWVDGRGWGASGESAQVARPVALKVSFDASGQTYVRVFTLRP
jgi:general secretion pathway protein J